MALAVTLGRITIQDVHPGNDMSTDMAISVAEAIARVFRGEYYTDAIVDREDGLVVFGGYVDAPSFHKRNKRGWHFASALCGYGGAGSHATATILELFGFGHHDSIFRQIQHGGDHVQYHFRKGAGLVGVTGS